MYIVSIKYTRMIASETKILELSLIINEQKGIRKTGWLPYLWAITRVVRLCFPLSPFMAQSSALCNLATTISHDKMYKSQKEKRKIFLKEFTFYDYPIQTKLMYTSLCNQVGFVNRLPLYPCKLSWVKIRSQKLITFFMNQCGKHSKEDDILCYCGKNGVECR